MYDEPVLFTSANETLHFAWLGRDLTPVGKTLVVLYHKIIIFIIT